MAKTYLGDGVYIEVDEYQMVKLTTSDGIKDTNTIYLEPEVCASLLRFLSTYKVEE